VSDTAVAYTPVSPDNAPAAFKPNWLPSDTGIPELDELRPTYERIDTERSAASAEVWRITDALEAAARRREDALRDAVLIGGDAPEPEDTDALEAELEQARIRSRAAGQALLAHVNNAVALIVEHHDEWISELDSRHGNARAELAEAEARVRELRAQTETGTKLAYWLLRTGREAATEPRQHFPYDELPDAEPTDPAELAGWKQQILERAMYGGSAFSKVAEAQRGREEDDLAPRHARETTQAIEDASDRMTADAGARLRIAMAGEPGVVSA
jgi:hypothetical protein